MSNKKSINKTEDKSIDKTEVSLDNLMLEKSISEQLINIIQKSENITKVINYCEDGKDYTVIKVSDVIKIIENFYNIQ